ncbi:MAG: hypothetical protein EYC70_10235 [Planctomycetota bacterium]|nr:MAG: hypothetical protein EYC70_10235 [Planctomycetota bacterium]
MRGARPIASICVLLAAACASADEREPALTPAARQEHPLAQALRMNETLHDDTSVDVSTTANLPRVDRDSRLELSFDQEALQRLAAEALPAPVSVLAEPPELAAARRQIPQLLAVTEQYLSALAESEEEARRFRETGTGDLEELYAKLGRRGDLDLQILRAARAALMTLALDRDYSVEQDENGEWLDERTARFLREEQDRLLPDGEPVDLRVLADLLNRQAQALESQARRALEAAEAANKLGLRVRGQILKGGEQEDINLHFEGYDEFPEGRGVVQKDAAFGLTPEDTQVLSERLAMVSSVASFINGARADPARLRSELEARRKELEGLLRDSLEATAAALQRLWEDVSGEDLARRLQDFGAAPADAEQVQAAAAALAGLRARDPLRRFGELRSSLLGAADGDVLQGLLRALDAGAGAWQEFQSLLADVQAIADGVAAAARVATSADLSALGPAARAEAEALLQGLADDASVRAVQDALAQLRAVGARHLSLLGTAREYGFRGSLDPATAVHPRPLDEAGPTWTRLRNYPADTGDRVRIQVDLVPMGQAQEAQEVQLPSYSQDFRVDDFGLQDSLDASLIFVNRVNEPGGNIPPTQFEASPSATWSIHYRKRQGTSDADDWAAVWNFINPGVGLHVAALSFEQSNELGVGAHVSLFGDLLQIGYGYNLNVDSDNRYFYLGIGLVEALNVASFGLSSATGIGASE